jgi:hypothetical protein
MIVECLFCGQLTLYQGITGRGSKRYGGALSEPRPTASGFKPDYLRFNPLPSPAIAARTFVNEGQMLPDKVVAAVAQVWKSRERR